MKHLNLLLPKLKLQFKPLSSKLQLSKLPLLPASLILLFSASITMLLLCSGCTRQALRPGDTVVPPVAGNQQEENFPDTVNPGYTMNISPLTQPSSNMVYTMIDKSSAPVSIFADNKFLYLLLPADNTGDSPVVKNNAISRYGNNAIGRHGKVIHVHDVESGLLAVKIESERLEECSTIAVKESNIYAYDMKTGKILLFSSGGKFLAEYDMGLPGIYAGKIAVTDSQHIVLLTREEAGESPKIAVYNVETGELNRYEADYHDSYSHSQAEHDEHHHEIIDFCLFGEKSILVALSCGRLNLFDIEKGAVEKSCLFPFTVGFIEYDGNVLYYTSDDPLYISPANAANFSNIKGGMYVGRILINNKFNWPQTEQELGDWLLSGIKVQAPDESGIHYRMAQNTKYLFFLDFIPATVQDGEVTQNEPGFVVYRIMK